MLREWTGPVHDVLSPVCLRGAWPTMPVVVRIRAVEDFALRMRAQREEMVRLLSIIKVWIAGRLARKAS